MPVSPPVFRSASRRRQQWRTTSNEGKTTTERGYGYSWRKLRERVLQRDKYLCQVCKCEGRLTPATQVDHIRNKAVGGTDDPENLQSICKPCHDVKTMNERSG